MRFGKLESAIDTFINQQKATLAKGLFRASILPSIIGIPEVGDCRIKLEIGE